MALSATLLGLTSLSATPWPHPSSMHTGEQVTLHSLLSLVFLRAAPAPAPVSDLACCARRSAALRAPSCG